MVNKISPGLEAQTSLQPQAAPTSAFVMPVRPPDTNGFLQLAEGLGRFSDKLGSIAAQERANQDRMRQNDIRGMAALDQLKGIQRSDQELKAQGYAPEETQMYNIVRGAYRGEAAGIQYAQELNQLSQDQTVDLQAAIAERRSAYVQNMSQTEAEAFLQRAQSAEAQAMANRRDYQIKTVQEDTRNASFSVIQNDVYSFLQQGLPVDELVANIQEKHGYAFRAAGIPLADLNTAMAKGFLYSSDLFLQNGDYNKAISALEAITASRPDVKNPGQVLPPLSSDPTVLGAVVQQRSQILSSMQRDQQAMAEVTKLRDEVSSAVTSNIPLRSVSSKAQDFAIQDYLSQSQTVAQTNGETPDQTIAREISWFATQGLTQPSWKAILEVGPNIPLGAIQAGQIPNQTKAALDLYRNIAKTNATYVGNLLTDTKAREFYETADTLSKEGGMTDDQALLAAHRSVYDNLQQNSTVNMADVVDAVKASGGSMFNPWGADALPPDATNRVYRLSLALARAGGMPVADAVKMAVDRVRKSTIDINGRAVYLPQSVTPEFKSAAERLIQDTFNSNKESLSLSGVESQGDLRVINLPNDPNTWAITDPTGATVLSTFSNQDVDSMVSQLITEARQQNQNGPSWIGRTIRGFLNANE